ncbi:ABC transporter ATP-binding protein [Amaricoccus solimangrovi]|nr:ATP-binding cassette domain-containing protein [Amaricoccus solimangrovi]
MNIIECDDLGRSFGPTVAVRSVSFSMARGAFLGLLGRNGAGKTTLLHMLTTLVAPDHGDARIDGASVRSEPKAVRAAIGMVFQDTALDGQLTARENLTIHAALHGLRRREAAAEIARSIAWADLEEAADRPTRALSGGMRRRLELARALMHRPRLIILDEPTLGLDTQGRRDLWRRIAGLRESGLSVLMTTHNIAEAEACCEIGVIDQGRLVARGSPAELSRRHGGMGLEEAFLRLTTPGPRDTALPLHAPTDEGRIRRIAR